MTIKDIEKKLQNLERQKSLLHEEKRELEKSLKKAQDEKEKTQDRLDKEFLDKKDWLINVKAYYSEYIDEYDIRFDLIIASDHTPRIIKIIQKLSPKYGSYDVFEECKHICISTWADDEVIIRSFDLEALLDIIEKYNIRVVVDDDFLKREILLKRIQKHILPE